MQHVIQIKNGIMKRVNVLVKILVYAKKIIRQQWRQISHSKKNGTGLDQRNDPELFIIINPVLSDTNGYNITVFSGPLDTSLVDTNMDEFNSKNKAEEDIEYNDSSSDKQESESEHFFENISKNAVHTWADKVVEGARNKKRLTLNRTRKKVWLTHSFKL